MEMALGAGSRSGYDRRFFVIMQTRDTSERFSGPSFEESAHLEDYLRDPVYRSSSRIRVSSPANGAVIDQELRFQ